MGRETCQHCAVRLCPDLSLTIYFDNSARLSIDQLQKPGRHQMLVLTVGIRTSNISPEVTDPSMEHLYHQRQEMGSIQELAKRNANLMRNTAIKQVIVIDRREIPLRAPSLPEPSRLGEEIIVEISRVPVCGRQTGLDVPLADDDGIRSIR